MAAGGAARWAGGGGRAAPSFAMRSSEFLWSLPRGYDGEVYDISRPCAAYCTASRILVGRGCSGGAARLGLDDARARHRYIWKELCSASETGVRQVWRETCRLGAIPMDVGPILNRHRSG